MNGILSIETGREGEVLIVFTVNEKEDVSKLAVHMIESGFDALYEPHNRDGSYVSCFICNEKTNLKICAI